MTGKNRQSDETIRDLHRRLEEAEEALAAIRQGEVDAVVVATPGGKDRVYLLEGADESYRVIVENMSEGAITIAPDGLILYANEQLASLTGFPLERIIGSQVRNLVLPEDVVVLETLLGHPEWRKAEVRLKRGIESAIPVYLSAKRLWLDTAERVCLVVTDLTENKRMQEILAAEHALRESEARLRTLGDNLPEGVIFRYCEGISGNPYFEFLSAGVEPITGVPAWEFKQDATAMFNLLMPEDLDHYRKKIAESRENLTPVEIEVRHRHRLTGNTHWSLLRSKPFRRPDGSTAWDGIQLDITERKKTQEGLRLKDEQLRQAQKMESIGVLAGGIAHDFNNLLTAVIGYASLALESIPETDPNHHSIEAVIDGASRAADLTRQLLAYAGKGRSVTRPVNISQTVRGMANLLRGSVPAIVDIDLDLDDEIPSIEADDSQIQQIIMNLVLNAFEAIGDRAGRIVIRTRNSIWKRISRTRSMALTCAPAATLRLKSAIPESG